MINDSITISFVGTLELKQLLETWAAQEDRTLSATLRQILAREAKRRQQDNQQVAKPN